VTRVLAALRDPDFRLENVVGRLRAHDWVQDARIGDATPGTAGITVQLVPSAAGARELRCRGKRHIVAVLGQHLQQTAGTAADRIDWRLVESLPAPGQLAATAPSTPAWMPIISDLEVAAASGSLTCQLRVPFDLPIFGGHFPSKPIVPGVIQVGWAVELARIHGLAAGRFSGVSTAKFRRLLQPGMRLAAHVERGMGAGQVRFTYRLGENVVTTGRLQFEGGHD
jgi:3-hydroxymyristoyl/3-hydroxydecanoyl-(acyl carrier protein) dehydratase